MLLKKIKAQNFKTYLDLDLDVTVAPEQPIILIGGANGGGKTTFFEAIYGALYGLKIPTPKAFKELLNAGAARQESEKIVLELHFSGKVLHEEQHYVLTRTYMLNGAGQPVESVKLNMNGSIFTYGTATPAAQKAEQEAQVGKIIKANLPQELSRYFLFDAMEAGNLLKEDQLNRVIRENIENVMGFNKYLQLAKAAERLYETQTAERLKVEKEKEEYLALLAEKKEREKDLEENTQRLADALQYSVANKAFYDELKSGLNEETTLKNKLRQTEEQLAGVYKKEKAYREELDDFVKDMEFNICLPQLANAVRSEVQLILTQRAEKETRQATGVSAEQITAISQKVLAYLWERRLLPKDVSATEVVDFVIAASAPADGEDPYGFLEHSEIKALEKLVQLKTINAFPALAQKQSELTMALAQTPVLQSQAESIKAQITGRDYQLLKQYEDNEGAIKKLEAAGDVIRAEIEKTARKLHRYDIQIGQEPDPRYEALQKLKPFFEDVANKLLSVKKEQIEAKMKADLNVNLAAYRDVIDRVALSEDLKDLSFKIYHTSGNEIYLNHLNTASKQVVVQVLLKALHELGDYEPPVMIDTVMGVLDEESRATLLEHYFPELSHQTILLSSDSEIRTGSDYRKIEPFISKSYTLVRDRQAQKTSVMPGYFGVRINEPA